MFGPNWLTPLRASRKGFALRCCAAGGGRLRVLPTLTLVCGAGTFWGTFPSSSSVVFYLLTLGLGTFVDFYLREIGPCTFVDLYLLAIGFCTTWSSSSWTSSCWCSGRALLGLLPPRGLVLALTSTCWRLGFASSWTSTTSSSSTWTSSTWSFAGGDYVFGCELYWL